MALNPNPLVVVDGTQGVVYDYSQNPPPSVVVSDIQPGIVFFYDNENPTNGSILLSDSTTSLVNYNGNFHFLTSIPMLAATGSGSSYNLIVGQNLAKNGQNVVNCASINLNFSTDGQETPVVTPRNFVNRNCSAIPNTSTYVFQPFLIPGLNPAYNTVSINVQSGQNAGIQNNVVILIYGDSTSLTTPLIGIIDTNGDNYTFSTTTKGNIYIMAFIQPSAGTVNGKTVVSFKTGDPETDSEITFDDDDILVGGKDDQQSDAQAGSKNKGCLGFLGLW